MVFGRVKINLDSINPSAFAPVPVKEFDWEARTQEFKENLITGAVVVGVTASIVFVPAIVSFLASLSIAELFYVASTTGAAYVISQIDTSDKTQ